MNFGIPYTKDQIDKIGNTIIYLAEKIQPLSKTQLLKLIYLIEEVSVKKYGMPFLNLRFDVWKFGPVSRDIYAELTGETFLLSKFIDKYQGADNATYIKSITAFSDDEFSDNEIELLDLVISHYNLNATQLVKITHRKHSLWYTTAKKHNVLEYLEEGVMNTTDFEIDFSDLLIDEPEKKAFYLDNKEFLSQSKALKY